MSQTSVTTPLIKMSKRLQYHSTNVNTHSSEVESEDLYPHMTEDMEYDKPIHIILKIKTMFTKCILDYQHSAPDYQDLNTLMVQLNKIKTSRSNIRINSIDRLLEHIDTYMYHIMNDYLIQSNHLNVLIDNLNITDNEAVTYLSYLLKYDIDESQHCSLVYQPIIKLCNDRSVKQHISRYVIPYDKFTIVMKVVVAIITIITLMCTEQSTLTITGYMIGYMSCCIFLLLCYFNKITTYWDIHYKVVGFLITVIIPSIGIAGPTEGDGWMLGFMLGCTSLTFYYLGRDEYTTIFIFEPLYILLHPVDSLYLFSGLRRRVKWKLDSISHTNVDRHELLNETCKPDISTTYMVTKFLEDHEIEANIRSKDLSWWQVKQIEYTHVSVVYVYTSNTQN
jgi:hypothetical protein